MSTFYGTMQGNRSAHTCGGSKASGFRAAAQSWDGSVITRLHYNEQGQLIVRVGTNDGSSCGEGWNGASFVGTFEEFKEFLQLYSDIKSGKVSITRHRAAK